jgi:hypothetical protein
MKDNNDNGLNEEQLAKLGHSFANLFSVKYNKKTDRYKLFCGEYSPVGVGRWALRLIKEANEAAEDDSILAVGDRVVPSFGRNQGKWGTIETVNKDNKGYYVNFGGMINTGIEGGGLQLPDSYWIGFDDVDDFEKQDQI